MTKVSLSDISGRNLVLSRTPEWSGPRKGYVLKRGVTTESAAQLAVRNFFRETASSLFGTVSGKMRYKGVDMPAMAVEMASRLRGKKYSTVSPEDRRQARHALTLRLISGAPLAAAEARERYRAAESPGRYY